MGKRATHGLMTYKHIHQTFTPALRPHLLMHLVDLAHKPEPVELVYDAVDGASAAVSFNRFYSPLTSHIVHIEVLSRK